MEVKITKTLRFKIFLVLFIIIIPLVSSLFYFNYRSMNIVTNKVYQSYENLFPFLVTEMEYIFKNYKDYLVRSITSESQQLNDYTNYPLRSSEFNRARYSLHNRLIFDSQFYPLIAYSFIVTETNPTPLYFAKEKEREAEFKAVVSLKSKNFFKIKAYSSFTGWILVEVTGKNYLMGVFERSGIAFGVFLDPQKFLPDEYIKDNLDIIVVSGKTIIDSSGSIPEAVLEEFLGDAENRIIQQNIKDLSNGNEYLVLHAFSKESSITYATFIDKRVILKELEVLNSMLLIIPLLILLVIFSAYLTFRKSLVIPITRIIHGMNRIINGELNVKIKEDGANELKAITRIFNNMLQTMQKLKISVYEEKIHVQEAELKHLQLQINPHFYSNCLNIIYNLAVIREYDVIKKLSINMAKYFRYIIKTNTFFTTYSKEIEHVNNYMEIQKIRFQEKISCEIINEGEVGQCRIPILSVQTFVENAIVHGMKKEGQVFSLKIHAQSVVRENDDYIVITIDDNGIGFSEEQLRIFNDAGYIKENPKIHIGIWNIYRRLEINYQQKARLSFVNNDSGGASIRMEIPFQGNDGVE